MWYINNEGSFVFIYSLTRVNLSVSCGGKCLSWVYRHPSQLSVPEVPTTVPPQMQPYWFENMNSTFLLEIQDNNSISSSALKNVNSWMKLIKAERQRWVAPLIKDYYSLVIITIMKCVFQKKIECSWEAHRFKSLVSIKLFTGNTFTIMKIQDKNMRNSIKSKNHLKSKTMRELEKLDIDWLVYCYGAKCTMQWAEEHIRKDVCRLNSKLTSTTNTQLASSYITLFRVWEEILWQINSVPFNAHISPKCWPAQERRYDVSLVESVLLLILSVFE